MANPKYDGYTVDELLDVVEKNVRSIYDLNTPATTLTPKQRAEVAHEALYEIRARQKNEVPTHEAVIADLRHQVERLERRLDSAIHALNFVLNSLD